MTKQAISQAGLPGWSSVTTSQMGGEQPDDFDETSTTLSGAMTPTETIPLDVNSPFINTLRASIIDVKKLVQEGQPAETTVEALEAILRSLPATSYQVGDASGKSPPKFSSWDTLLRDFKIKDFKKQFVSKDGSTTAGSQTALDLLWDKYAKYDNEEWVDLIMSNLGRGFSKNTGTGTEFGKDVHKLIAISDARFIYSQTSWLKDVAKSHFARDRLRLKPAYDNYCTMTSDLAKKGQNPTDFDEIDENLRGEYFDVVSELGFALRETAGATKWTRRDNGDK